MAHSPWHELPSACRCIVALRNPKDAAVSFYRFLEGWFLDPGAIPIEDLPGVVQRIADFLFIDDEWCIDVPTRQATFEFVQVGISTAPSCTNSPSRSMTIRSSATSPPSTR